MRLLDQNFTAFLLLLLSLGASAQLERPKASPYTLEGTYEKLVEDHPFVRPIAPLDSTSFSKREDFTYLEREGVELRADAYFPKGRGSGFPTVLLVHGGGWISGSRENQRPMAQALAQRGFLALTIDYRLADRAKYPAALGDLKGAVDFLYRSDLPLDRERIAILGASAGAQLATLAGQLDSRIKAIVNVDGIVSFVHPESREGTYAAYWLGGTRSERPDLWKEASPLEAVHRGSPPILFLNSAQSRFHAGRDDLIKKYGDWGIYSEVHTFPDSPHSFWLVEPWFDRSLALSVEFLNKVLQ